MQKGLMFQRKMSRLMVAYFKTCWNFDPKIGPGFVLGTRHVCSSSLSNFTRMFNVMASDSLSDFAVGLSSNHLRLS